MTQLAEAEAPAFLSAPPRPAQALTPHPGRSLAWIVLRSAWGTWFLIAIHAGVLALPFITITWLDWALLVPIALLRGFLTTGVLHRYFSHRSFKTTRVFQFLLGFLACANLQRGPLWWAAIHRHHHRHSDEPADAHSPVQGGFLWSYAGWMFTTLERPDYGTVRDLTRYPELLWLERLWLVPALLLAGLCWLAGGWGMLCLDFCLTAVLALHGASVVNSVGHLIGSRRYDTPDRSRNSYFLALLTLGDGWHNNHHHYPHSAEAGFFPGEIDGSFFVIQALAWVGLVWGIRRVPAHKLNPAPRPERRSGPALRGHRRSKPIEQQCPSNEQAGTAMAQRVLSPEKLKEIRELATGWGKVIARRAFGEPGTPDAPVDFLAMEEAASVAASALAEGTLGALFDLQAGALDPSQPCPDCRRPCPVGTEERPLVVRHGTLSLQEPVCHCPGCRRDFFPPPGRPAPGQPRLQPRRDAQDR